MLYSQNLRLEEYCNNGSDGTVNETKRHRHYYELRLFYT